MYVVLLGVRMGAVNVLAINDAVQQRLQKIIILQKKQGHLIKR